MNCNKYTKERRPGRTLIPGLFVNLAWQNIQVSASIQPDIGNQSGNPLLHAKTDRIWSDDQPPAIRTAREVLLVAGSWIATAPGSLNWLA
jgi:hypothetical protein